jgi:predicted anti-sigma-YlaC factor YlaD
MNTAMKLDTDCKSCRSHLADLLLDDAYTASHPELEQHLASCSDCHTELNELRSTFALLDEYAAPEPSPFFDTRLHARLREAVAAEPESLWERMRSFLLFSTGRSFQPAVACALALVLLVGGSGTFLQLHNLQQKPANTAASATINDLKVLDNNAQEEQQMNQLLDTSGSADEDTPPAS